MTFLAFLRSVAWCWALRHLPRVCLLGTYAAGEAIPGHLEAQSLAPFGWLLPIHHRGWAVRDPVMQELGTLLEGLDGAAHTGILSIWLYPRPSFPPPPQEDVTTVFQELLDCFQLF